MSEVAENQRTMSEEEIQQKLKDTANAFGYPFRAPVLKTPADYGLEFEEVTFQAQDGVPLEAWFIPRSGSNKLIIVNHPLWFNRYGCPSDREPWRSIGGWAGNTFEVNYMQDYRILHDAGYNVLTYDERNFGLSSPGNAGRNSGGRLESRDVIGSLIYARTREDLKDMTVGLFSRCNGANATLFAIHSQPEYFKDVRCLVAAQPLSVRVALLRNLEELGIPDHLDDLEQECKLLVSFGFDEMAVTEWAKAVHLPTFIYQVHDDKFTKPCDVQEIFDNIPTAEKKLHWIYGTTKRWDGYLEFQRRPDPMLAWFEKYMP